MTYFMQSGTAYIPSEHSTVLTKLPPSTFTVMVDARGQYFLEENPPLSTVPRIYGDVEARIERVVRSYEDRSLAGSGMGVLLSGSKGSGKTLFTKLISSRMVGKDVPTILVNSPHHGDGFMALMKSISQPSMFVFDEFEKVYSDRAVQQSLLTMFDGVGSSASKLFLVSVNDMFGVSDFFYNRPGRFYYHFKYEGVDEPFIREYCEELLVDKTGVEGVVEISKFFSTFNFDMLKAIVEEMNRFSEPAKEVIKYLNAAPVDEKSTYKAVDFSGLALTVTNVKEVNTVTFNPIKDSAWFSFTGDPRKVAPKRVSVPDDPNDYFDSDPDASSNQDDILVRPEFIKEYTARRITYEIPRRGRLVIARVERKDFSLHNFLG